MYNKRIMFFREFAPKAFYSRVYNAYKTILFLALAHQFVIIIILYVYKSIVFCRFAERHRVSSRVR